MAKHSYRSRLLLAVLMASFSSDAFAGREVVEDEVKLKAIFASNTYAGINPKGSNFVVYYEPNGEMRGKAISSRGIGQDSGTWSIESGKYCPQWKKWRKGQKECHSVFMDGDKIWLENPDPELKSEGVIKKGNPDNL